MHNGSCSSGSSPDDIRRHPHPPRQMELEALICSQSIHGSSDPDQRHSAEVHHGPVPPDPHALPRTQCPHLEPHSQAVRVSLVRRPSGRCPSGLAPEAYPRAPGLAPRGLPSRPRPQRHTRQPLPVSPCPPGPVPDEPRPSALMPLGAIPLRQAPRGARVDQPVSPLWPTGSSSRPSRGPE